LRKESNMLDTQEVERLDVDAVNSAKIRQPLYAKRKKIFPKAAEGRFRRFKWIVMLITLGIYYITPWIRWDRGPYAPDQAVLVDMANRRFYFFLYRNLAAGILLRGGPTCDGRFWSVSSHIQRRASLVRLYLPPNRMG
jgi:hypothetical protein